MTYTRSRIFPILAAIAFSASLGVAGDVTVRIGVEGGTAGKRSRSVRTSVEQAPAVRRRSSNKQPSVRVFGNDSAARQQARQRNLKELDAYLRRNGVRDHTRDVRTLRSGHGWRLEKGRVLVPYGTHGRSGVRHGLLRDSYGRRSLSGSRLSVETYVLVPRVDTYSLSRDISADPDEDVEAALERFFQTDFPGEETGADKTTRPVTLVGRMERADAGGLALRTTVDGKDLVYALKNADRLARLLTERDAATLWIAVTGMVARTEGANILRVNRAWLVEPVK